MARKSGLVSSLVRAQHEAEKRRAAQIKVDQRNQTKAAEAVRKAYENATQKERAILCQTHCKLVVLS